MHHTSPIDNALHLALFVTGAIAFAVASLAVLERLAGGRRRVIRWYHVAIPVAAFAMIGIAERLYHYLEG